MALYTLKAAASSSTPRDPFPIFWKPDYKAPGCALAGVGA